jgi:hypothetical protein
MFFTVNERVYHVKTSILILTVLGGALFTYFLFNTLDQSNLLVNVLYSLIINIVSSFIFLFILSERTTVCSEETFEKIIGYCLEREKDDEVINWINQLKDIIDSNLFINNNTRNVLRQLFHLSMYLETLYSAKLELTSRPSYVTRLAKLTSQRDSDSLTDNYNIDLNKMFTITYINRRRIFLVENIKEHINYTPVVELNMSHELDRLLFLSMNSIHFARKITIPYDFFSKNNDSFDFRYQGKKFFYHHLQNNEQYLGELSNRNEYESDLLELLPLLNEMGNFALFCNKFIPLKGKIDKEKLFSIISKSELLLEKYNKHEKYHAFKNILATDLIMIIYGILDKSDFIVKNGVVA